MFTVDVKQQSNNNKSNKCIVHKKMLLKADISLLELVRPRGSGTTWQCFVGPLQPDMGPHPVQVHVCIIFVKGGVAVYKHSLHNK